MAFNVIEIFADVIQVFWIQFYSLFIASQANADSTSVQFKQY